jgi:hypothetical protein
MLQGANHRIYLQVVMLFLGLSIALLFFYTISEIIATKRSYAHVANYPFHSIYELKQLSLDWHPKKVHQSSSFYIIFWSLRRVERAQYH